MFDLDAFMAERVPWRYARLYYKARGALVRAARRLRYRRVPPGGWGEGWRVLIFRCKRRGEPARRLHVLAPVRGDAFDWDRLKPLVNGQVRPSVEHPPGVLVGEMRWAGNHIGVATDAFGTQRLPMDRLVPGAFRGGVDVGLVLLDVRDAPVRFEPPDA
ncbi:hypothetical protein [Brevundimonas sp. FT23042]|uniref:hypothetical protein n=1 Tax=Brevundimonas sp. FT23042 TaxID=3393749 RepID=UPI003B5873EB